MGFIEKLNTVIENCSIEEDRLRFTSVTNFEKTQVDVQRTIFVTIIAQNFLSPWQLCKQAFHKPVTVLTIPLITHGQEQVTKTREIKNQWF